MASSGGKLTGQEKVAARLRTLEARFGERIPAALYRRGEAIMAVSKSRYVPVDLGVLKGSGRVHPPVRNGRTVSVTLSYGGAAKAYALAVHEHPSRYSPPSWRGQVNFSPAGTGPKYLERPLMIAVATMAQDLARDLNLERM